MYSMSVDPEDFDRMVDFPFEHGLLNARLNTLTTSELNEAIASNPAYIQLEALKALQSISKDPAAKMYFLNGDSPMPLPLMNMGEPLSVQPN